MQSHLECTLHFSVDDHSSDERETSMGGGNINGYLLHSLPALSLWTGRVLLYLHTPLTGRRTFYSSVVSLQPFSPTCHCHCCHAIVPAMLPEGCLCHPMPLSCHLCAITASHVLPPTPRGFVTHHRSDLDSHCLIFEKFLLAPTSFWSPCLLDTATHHTHISYSAPPHHTANMLKKVTVLNSSVA